MGKIIQLENNAANIAFAFREQFKHKNICITDEFDTPAGKLIVSNLVWELGWLRDGAAVTHSVSHRDPDGTDFLAGKKVEFVQPANVSLSTAAQIQASGPARPEVTQTIELHLIFAFEINFTPTDVFLLIRYIGLEGLPDLPALQQLRQMIAGLLPFQKVPIDIATLSGLGGKPPVTEAGISAIVNDQDPGDRDGKNFILIRIEIGNAPANTDLWETFYGSPHDATFHTQGKNGFIPGRFSWSFFTDEYFLTTRIAQEVDDSFRKSGKFKLKGGMGASWSASDNRAIVNLDFYGKAIDACDRGIFGSDDIDLRVNVPIELSVLQSPLSGKPYVYDPGTVQQNVRINYWKSDWDTAFCIATSTLVWPYLGSKLLEEGAIEWYTLVGTIAMGPFVSFAILYYANKGGLVPSPGSNCVRPDKDKDEFVCQRKFDPGTFPLGGLPLVIDYFGRYNGLQLLGGVSWNQRVARGFSIASIDVKQPGISAPVFTCQQVGAVGLARITQNPEDFASYNARIHLNFEVWKLDSAPAALTESLSKTDLIQPYICAARVRPEDDPLNVFAPYVTIDDNEVNVQVPLTKVPSSYFTPGSSYSCRVLIITSVGARMITLQPLVKASAEEVKKIISNAWTKKFSDCNAKSQGYDPSWEIDPSDYYQEKHLWGVQVAGLKPSEQITLEDQRGRLVASARAGSQGLAQLRAFLSPNSYNGQLSLRRGSSQPMPVRSLRGEGQGNNTGVNPTARFALIDVRQTQLLLLSEIETNEPVLEALPIMLGTQTGLLTVQSSGVTVYDLSQPEQPMPVLHSAQSGLSGVITSGKHTFLWGPTGIFALEMDLERREIGVTELYKAPVLGMARVGLKVCFLTCDRLEIWNEHRCCEKAIEAPQARSLTATSTHLLIGSDNCVTVYRILDQECLVRSGEHRMEGLSRIVTSDLVISDHQFILENCSKSELIDVADPERILSLGEYHSLPEQGLLTRYRDLLIEKDRDPRFIRLYSVGKTALV